MPAMLQPTDLPAPPVAERRPVEHHLHGDTRIDEYGWLRDRDDAAVIAHLEAENAYADAATAHLGELRGRLYAEIRSRIQETDESAPVPDGELEYVTRTVEGLQYPIHVRHPRGGGPETVVVDENQVAEGHDFTEVGDLEMSPDQRLCAYTVDHTGGERMQLRIRDLATGADLPDVVDDVYYSVAWHSDAGALLYTRPDQAMRPHQVWRHVVGTAADTDQLLLEEPDERFFLEVDRTRSGALLLITAASHTTSEVHIVDAADPSALPRLVDERRQDVEYSVDHHPGMPHGAGQDPERLYIVTNDGGARDFRLVTATLDRPDHRHWEEVLPHRPGTRLLGVDLFEQGAVLGERDRGVRTLRVLPLVHGIAHPGQVEDLRQPEAVSRVTVGANREWAATTIRCHYTSLTTPPSDIDHSLAGGGRTVVKVQPVAGGYDPTAYITERHWAVAEDGAEVPISLVRHRGVPLDGSAPCLLYGYGAYEYSRDPAFSSLRLSLLDRGFVYAIAHVRGGGEMGRSWYEGGRLLAKRTTFTDFASCADHLVREGFTSHDRLGIRGGSAGGLLIGAVVNLRPDLAAAAVAEVPFVDLINTMLDPSLPLTVIEYEEWGNPEERDFYEYMRSYAPYENVAAADHPALLVLGGLNDPRVGFWEPAKWVARLRERTTSTRPILLQTEMGAGHMGPSGRYEAWRKEAFVLSWLLDRLPGWEEP